MPFDDSIIDSEILAVHGALVPGGSLGRVLLFGGDEHNVANEEPATDTGWRKTRLYDVASRSLVTGTIPSPDSDVFCAGHAFLPDGRLLIAGGTSEWGEDAADHPGDDPHHVHGLAFGGHRLCWVYNPSDNAWADVAPLLPEPGKTTGGGRWYPTLVTLGTGEVIAFFGHPRFDDDRHRNTIAEKYHATHDAWTPLPQMADPTIYPGGSARYLMYPRVFQVPDGRLFFATGMPVESESTYHSTHYDPVTGDYVGDIISEPSGYGNGWDYPAVLLPLLPDDDYRARILFAGNVTPRRIDLGATTPAWTATSSRQGSVADRRRNNAMVVILPTGRVAVTGGVHVTNPEEPVLKTEIYEPGIDWGGGGYGGAVSEHWSTDDDEAQHARNYHSIALLLPDGTVLTSGGNTNASSGSPDDDVVVDGVTKKRGITNIEIYEPEYVAEGGRPTLTGAPLVVSYGQQMDVTSPQAASIQRVAMIRFGSATHGHNYDQRYVGLEFERDGEHLYLTTPPNGNVAPPGFYTLWVVDDQDRPCAQAAIVRLGSLGCDLVLDRSSFGVHEVEALLEEATPAVVPNAVYAVYDGFRPVELGDPPTPPTPSLRFIEGGDVPTNHMRLVHRETLLEDPAASDDVVQRITFVFDVEFGSTAVFGGITDHRDVRVTLAHGEHECDGTLRLLAQPNPYMLDIGGEDNPHWLSIDLRVLTVMEDEAFEVAPGVALTQGSSSTAPTTFLQSLVDGLGDHTGAFEAVLETDQQTSAIELSRTVNGRRAYNYAIAQVRYRALTVDASDVQVFFRMFTTAATNLRYDPTTTYRRDGDWPNSTPLLGTVAGELVTIPFFAAPRVDTTAGGVAMTSQSDPLNRRTIAAGGTAEVTEYFGAWLDINQTTARFPILPGSSDGPFLGTTPLTRPRSIQELVRGQHQCLVAEVRFQPGATDPIPVQSGPGQSDRLAQRNLVIVESDNPGAPASRTAAHTFELSPSPHAPVGYPTGVALGRGAGPAHAEVAALALKRRPWPDELLIRWGSIPVGSKVELTLADVDVDEILALAATRQGPPVLRGIDPLTLGITVGGATWVPLPGPAPENIAALLSITLPDGVTAGDHYVASVSQVSGPLRTVLGSWQLSVPVRKASQLRAKEVRTLSVLKHIAAAIPPENRWNPIFDRYVDLVAGRVESFGNDPTDVHGNPDGDGTPWDPGDEAGGGRDPYDPDRDRPAQGRDGVAGKIVRIEFDACGCFRGFVLRSCNGSDVAFRSSDRGVERVVRKACADSLTVRVREKRGRIIGLRIECDC